jgi:hypothetical protein
MKTIHPDAVRPLMIATKTPSAALERVRARVGGDPRISVPPKFEAGSRSRRSGAKLEVRSNHLAHA